MKGITKKQLEVLDFIRCFIEENRYSPSLREIQSHFGFSSVAGVHKHVEALKRKGFLLSELNRKRSLTPAKEPQKQEARPEIEIPFIGTVAAGLPIETFPHSQSIFVPDFLVHAPDKTYVLRAKGDSLEEEMIVDGDFLVVEAREEAHAGETIIALINRHDTIIKRYHPEGGYVRLAGHNAGHQPIIIRQEDVLIQGVLNGIIRIYL